MTTRRWRGEAPAKVNLRLRILAREAGGYHQLETVFQALELADRLEVELRRDAEVRLEVTGVPEGALGPDEENLAVRAALAFRSRAAERRTSVGGAEIRLEKRIPHGAGLGGGSSDAAAVLRGLNELHGRPLEQDELLALGGELGADVPFFLTGASRALAWGRGGRLLPLPSLSPREVVVAVPSQEIPTSWAYRVLAEHRERTGIGRRSPAAAMEALVCGGEDGWLRTARDAENDFEAALFPLRPELEGLKQTLGTSGGAPVLLAGSGSAVFGVFPDGTAAEAGAKALEPRIGDGRILRTRTAG